MRAHFGAHSPWHFVILEGGGFEKQHYIYHYGRRSWTCIRIKWISVYGYTVSKQNADWSTWVGEGDTSRVQADWHGRDVLWLAEDVMPIGIQTIPAWGNYGG